MDKRLKIWLESIFQKKGTDAATDALKKVGGAGGVAADGLEKSNKEAGNFGSTLKALLASQVLVGIGQRLMQFGQQSIQTASDVFEASSKFEFVFGPAAAATTRELESFAETAQRSRFELKEMAANIGGVTEGLLGSKSAAATVSTEFTKLAVDLASFYNVAEKDALGALTSGLIGETEPLRRFGVLLNANTVQAEIFAQGWAESKKEITEAMKVQARYNIILRSTETAQGDATRTAASHANQTRNLSAVMQELQVEIGTALLPVMTLATTKFANLAAAAVDAARRMAPALSGLGGEMGAIAEETAAAGLAQAETYEDLEKRLASTTEAYRTAAFTIAGSFTGTQDEAAQAVVDTAIALAKQTHTLKEFEDELAQAGFTGTLLIKVLEAAGAGYAHNAEELYNYAQEQKRATQEVGNADLVLRNYIRTMETAPAGPPPQMFVDRSGRMTGAREEAAAIREAALAAKELADETERLATQDEIALFMAAEGFADDLIAGYEALAMGAEDGVERVIAAQDNLQESYRETAFNALLAGAETAEAFDAAIEAGLAIGAITPAQAQLQQTIRGTRNAVEELNIAYQNGEIDAATYGEAFALVTGGVEESAQAALQRIEDVRQARRDLLDTHLGLNDGIEAIKEAFTGGSLADMSAAVGSLKGLLEIDSEQPLTAIEEVQEAAELMTLESYIVMMETDHVGAALNIDELQRAAETISNQDYVIRFRVETQGSFPNPGGASPGDVAPTIPSGNQEEEADILEEIGAL